MSLATTRISYACGGMRILIGYDLPGADLIARNFSNYNLCCSWCLSYTGCAGYTWGLPGAGWAAYTCFLKNRIPSRNARSVLVSAYR